jgi:N-methylhydantoinase B/oxoprolinase/acetone carboxylase alpha subunit
LRGRSCAAGGNRLPLDFSERARRCHCKRTVAGYAGQGARGSGPHHLYVLAGSDPRTGAYFVNYETLAGGMGARANRDGVDGVRVHASGSSNLPVEALEHAYPFRVERYALWEGSAGTGQYRGGMGVCAITGY